MTPFRPESGQAVLNPRSRCLWATAVCLPALLLVQTARAQFTIQPLPEPQQQPELGTPGSDEQASLVQAIREGQTSPVDQIRALEEHLKQFPESIQRPEVGMMLAKAAIDALDYPRIVQYGEPVLARNPGDVLLLDRVALALLMIGGAENADRAYGYARTFEDMLNGYNIAPGPDATRRQEERDRALGRVLLYEARARTITEEHQEAVRLAARAFSAYPNEESAREWAEALYRAGRPEEAITHMAEAFAIPDPRADDSKRLDDRLVAGEWYEEMHGSEAGLGDIFLEAYDRTSRLVETRQKKLLALDPNAATRNPMEFTLTRLDGKRFQLSSLLGKVVVLDFWATWCVPCRVQHPLYEQLKQRFPESRGVVFLAVSADEDHSVVEPFLEEQGWDKTVYFEDGLARLLNVQSIPSTILFDRQGQMASRMDGFDPSAFLDTMTRRLESILAQDEDGTGDGAQNEAVPNEGKPAEVTVDPTAPPALAPPVAGAGNQ